MPNDMQSRQYYDFIMKRIEMSKQLFIRKFREENIEIKYAGLYCLLRLAQEPSEEVAEEASYYLHHFYFPEHYANNSIDLPKF